MSYLQARREIRVKLAVPDRQELQDNVENRVSEVCLGHLEQLDRA